MNQKQQAILDGTDFDAHRKVCALVKEADRLGTEVPTETLRTIFDQSLGSIANSGKIHMRNAYIERGVNRAKTENGKNGLDLPLLGLSEENAFYAIEYDFQVAPDTTNAAQLAQNGIIFPLEYSNAQFHAILQVMAWRSIFICGTGSMLDIEIFEALRHIVMDTVKDLPIFTDKSASHVDEWINLNKGEGERDDLPRPDHAIGSPARPSGGVIMVTQEEGNHRVCTVHTQKEGN